MEIMIVIMIVINVFLMLFGIWLFINNELTYRDRMNALNEFCNIGNPNFLHNIEEFTKFSYENHLFHRMTFRNPRKKYNFKENIKC